MTVFIGTLMLVAGLYAVLDGLNGTVGTRLQRDLVNQAAAYYLGQAMVLTQAFDILQQSGRSPQSIAFDKSSPAGLFNPANVRADEPGPAAGEASKSNWVYRGKAIDFKGVGSDVDGDYAFVKHIEAWSEGTGAFGGERCDRINVLAGSPARSSYSFSPPLTNANLLGTASGAVMYASDLTTKAALSTNLSGGRTLGLIGCVQTSTSDLFLYVIVKSN